MTPLQTAAKDIIDRWDSPKWTDPRSMAEVVLTLRKALADELQQSVEPVAWLIESDYVTRSSRIAKYWGLKGVEVRELYLHPPQQAKQVPLTNEEVLTLVPGLLDCLCDPYDKQRSGDDYSSVPVDMLRLARAIEAHHGIGGQP